MAEILASLDMCAAAWLPAVWRVSLWGLFSAAVSMAIYFFVSPQQKILALKQSQKEARRSLMQHDGDFKELNVLIRKDLSLSFQQIGLAIGPFLLSLVPLVFLMIYLLELYNYPLVAFGPEWMQTFEFWYITVLVVGSLAIKVLFKIA